MGIEEIREKEKLLGQYKSCLYGLAKIIPKDSEEFFERFARRTVSKICKEQEKINSMYGSMQSTHLKDWDITLLRYCCTSTN
ncbi:hypothetical protein KY314_00740 [Candidatus Woesearchaeota archaeon]|nr:hypothetical protein [Candidatus Woesearchaeota archaeon]